MRHYYSADVIREAEAPLLASLPDGALMRRAAYGLATAIARELIARTGGVAGRSVCAVVGSGDNGGDALWAATFLRRRGAAAAAVLLNPERAHQKALAAFRRAGGRVVQSVPAATDLVIDGVVGISGLGPAAARRCRGLRRRRRGRHPRRRRRHPQRRRRADRRGRAVPHVHAALTVTFGGLKPVHALGDCGRVELVDIGLDLPPTDVMSFDAADVAARWPMPGPKDDKYTQGVTGVLAGSATYPGAAVLCTGAAVAATSGMVRYAGSAAAASAFALARGHRIAERRRGGPRAGLGRRTRARHRRRRRRRAVVRARHRPAGDRRRRRADHPRRAPRPARRPHARRRC